MPRDRIMFRELKRIDPILMQRCQLVLAESGGRILEADDLTDALRRKFPEYDRRKRALFRPLVAEYFRVLDVGEVLTGADRAVFGRAKVAPRSSDTLAAVKKADTDELRTSAANKRKAEADIDAEVEQALVKKKKREREKEVPLVNPKVTFADLGGMEKELVEVVHLLTHMKHPEIYSGFGILPPRGLLIHGPPGCGKTLLVSAIAGQLELPLLKVSAPEIVAGVSGESEQRIRELFEQAVNSAPCIFFIDEIDAVTPKRETAQREMEKRIVSQLLTCIDELCSRKLDNEVLLIGATHRLDSLDPALRRAGRFNREVSLGIPTEASRSSILRVLCRSLRLENDFNYDRIAHLTPGFVGADLQDLTREATSLAVKRLIKSIESRLENDEDETSRTDISDVKTATRSLLEQSLKTLMSDWNLSREELDDLRIFQEDFLDAIQIVQPSAKREGFATVPGVTWQDVGAMKDIRETLNVYILAAVKHREKYEALGLNTSTGILMHGPPGCGKTLIAKAVANESGINFISVKGPELLNMYVGESEKAIRQVFQRARASAPCVIFFDELDALCPRRSDSSDGGSTSRVVNQLLTEMDGLESRKQVFVLAATNRPDIIDPAMLRPGRLDHIIHVGLPDRNDREDILRALTKNARKPKIEGISLASIADLTDTFSGAELASLVKTASISALTQQLKSDPEKPVILAEEHFREALEKMRASKRESSSVNKTKTLRN